MVLCGAEAPQRKFVDWEIKATLDKEHGLIGINLRPIRGYCNRWQSNRPQTGSSANVQSECENLANFLAGRLYELDILNPVSGIELDCCHSAASFVSLDATSVDGNRYLIPPFGESVKLAQSHRTSYYGHQHAE